MYFRLLWFTYLLYPMSRTNPGTTYTIMILGLAITYIDFALYLRAEERAKREQEEEERKEREAQAAIREALRQ